MGKNISSKNNLNQQQKQKQQRENTLLEILGRERFKHCKGLVEKLRLAMNTKVAQLRCNINVGSSSGGGDDDAYCCRKFVL